MALMGWSLDETIGKLHRFWWWCLDFAPTGDLRKFNDNVLGGSVGLSADMSVKFVRAMVEACWLDRGNGVFRVHDWPHYAGRFLRDTRFKRQPERWKEVQSLYEIPVSRQSADNPPNQPTNQPTKSTHTAREGIEGHRPPPTLATVLAHASTAGIPPEVAEKFFHEAEARTFAASGMWTDIRGNEMGNWKNALQAYWLGWQNRNHGKHENRNEIDRDRNRTGIKTTAGNGLRSL